MDKDYKERKIIHRRSMCHGSKLTQQLDIHLLR